MTQQSSIFLYRSDSSLLNGGELTDRYGESWYLWLLCFKPLVYATAGVELSLKPAWFMRTLCCSAFSGPDTIRSSLTREIFVGLTLEKGGKGEKSTWDGSSKTKYCLSNKFDSLKDKIVVLSWWHCRGSAYFYLLWDCLVLLILFP